MRESKGIKNKRQDKQDVKFRMIPTGMGDEGQAYSPGFCTNSVQAICHLVFYIGRVSFKILSLWSLNLGFSNFTYI